MKAPCEHCGCENSEADGFPGHWPHCPKYRVLMPFRCPEGHWLAANGACYRCHPLPIAVAPEPWDREPREGLCMICRHAYPTWSADNDLWNATVRKPDGSDEYPFLCPTCFANLAVEREVETMFRLGPYCAAPPEGETALVGEKCWCNDGIVTVSLTSGPEERPCSDCGGSGRVEGETTLDGGTEQDRLNRLAGAKEAVEGAATALSGQWSESWVERLRDAAKLLGEQDAELDWLTEEYGEATRDAVRGYGFEALLRRLAPDSPERPEQEVGE